MSKECTPEEYQLTMSHITKSFQALSKEVIATIKEFGECGLTEAAGILERVQQTEKEKLELTVKWQVLAQQERERQGEESEEVDDFGATEYQKKELKKKYCLPHCLQFNEFILDYFL